MAPILHTVSTENNNSAATIESAKCESSVSKKTSSSTVQSSQCQQNFTKTSGQMSNSAKSSHVSDIKSGSESKLPSLSNNTSSVHSSVKGANSNQYIPLSIQTRGNFFEDTFFNDVRENFQKAVNEVLEKCGQSSSLCDNMTSYRKLRQLELKEENQAGTVSYGEKEHKIVLDVHDFKQDDITVKVVENNTIQITGHVEKKNGNSVSTQSFHRQFTLPGTVDMTMVTSSLSSDGILTIIVPRLENKQISNIHHTTDINGEFSKNKELNQCSKKNNNATENCMQTKSDTSKSSVISQASNIKSTVEAQSSSSISNYADTCSKDKFVNGASIKQPAHMTIVKRGNFFEDTFFADVHDNFQKAVSEVLEKWGEKSSLCDDMISYRNLRQRDLKEENQAATVSYGDKEHKIVLDVNDFKEGDIKVKIIDTNTVQITGNIEKKNGNAISTQSFQRQFTLPGLPDTECMAMATSSMSSDGILTVIIPRVATKQMISNSKKDDICKESNLNKEATQCSHVNTITTGKSMKAMDAGETKSCLISQKSNTKSGIETNLSSLNSNTEDVYPEVKNTHGASNRQPESMTIRKRGNFFEDSFFADVHTHFQKAINEVLEKFGETASVGDYMTSYRNLRQHDLKEENQAATVSYGENEHKIVLDVNDFKEGDIKVKIIDYNTVQITGTIEKKNGNANSTQSFHRQFTLPGLPGTVDMTLATSSMSSDGILTVIIPRVATKQMISNTKKDICKESNLNKEANKYNNENTITTGKSMKARKAEETKPSIISQAFNIETGIGANLYSNSKTTDICSGDNDSNLNKEINECSNKNAATTGKSMKTIETEDSKSSLISQESNTKSRNEISLSSLNNITADVCSEDKDRQGTSTDRPKSMTIKKKGNFFEDSFFADVRTNFQKAVSEILDKFGETSSVGEDMTSYRNLRQRNLKEENQAATVTYGEKEHKIVLDVNDFKEGDIKVEIINYNTVQITGTTEMKNGNITSTQSFHRQFTLPGLPGTLDMTLATSSISSDGILTIIIPRIVAKQIISNTNEGDICKESNMNKELNECSHDNTISLGKSMKSEDTKSSKISQSSNIESGIGKKISISNSNTADVFSDDKNSNLGRETNECSKENTTMTDKSVKTMKTQASESSLISQETNPKSGIETNLSSPKCNTTYVCSEDKDTKGTNTLQPKSMTIRKRGNFFEDSFFADVHEKFQKAVSEVLEKYGETSSVGDDMTSYRNLRKHDLKEENQAATVSYGEKEHKIVLDVNDFKEGDIKVKIIEDNTVQITAHIEKKKENAISTQNFHRQFTLPGTLDMTLVTSSMSSDGILTVIIPRLATKQMISNIKKDDICKESNSKEEANKYINENTMTTGKSMKAMKAEETKSSIISQAFNIDSGIGDNVYSNNKTADVCSGDNDSNLNKERNESSNENAVTTGKSMKTMKTEDSKSSLISRESNTKSVNETNLSSLNNITADVCSEDKDRQGTSTGRTKSMTIKKKGNFFENSFFADVRTNFQKAVSEILDKFGETSSVGEDMTSYRNLRKRDLKEENQAATVSYGEKEHKIVLDVNDFKNGDIKVNIIDYNTVQITGTIEKKNGNITSTQSFHRQFTLPGLPGTVDMTLATSSLSSDGILTIIIPRIEAKKIISNTKEDDTCKESKMNKELNECSHDNTISLGKSMKSMKSEDTKSSKISQASNTESGIGKNLSISKSNTAEVFSDDKKSNLDRETNECSKENITMTGKSVKTLKTQALESSLISQETNTKSGFETNLSSSKCNTTDVCSEDKDTKWTSTLQPKSMTIRKRGDFFEDSFFADVHEKFQKAVGEVLEKYGETSSVGDDMTSYRNLRQHDLKEENQAATVSYGENEHKIVLDVNDFKEGDIKVKIIEENTVQITGHIEKKKENAISTQSFHRQFTLPGTLDMTLVTSSMSSDGILTVIIPRLVNKQMILNIKKQNNFCKESNLNKETNQRSNENTKASSNALKAMKEDSKSSVVSHAKQATKQHIQQSSSYNCSQNSSSTLEPIQTPSHVNSISNNNETSDVYSPINLSIRRRGQFFQDSFFNDSQKQFDEAMKSILHEFENTNHVTDTEQRYRNLRQKELKEEQQACSMIQDSQKHKIVVDVKEFMEGNINVKVIGETEIFVEGENKQQTGISIASQRFNRSFMLPNKIDPTSVQSSLSSDGILTITVPKIMDTAGNTKY